MLIDILAKLPQLIIYIRGDQISRLLHIQNLGILHKQLSIENQYISVQCKYRKGLCIVHAIWRKLRDVSCLIPYKEYRSIEYSLQFKQFPLKNTGLYLSILLCFFFLITVGVIQPLRTVIRSYLTQIQNAFKHYEGYYTYTIAGVLKLYWIGGASRSRKVSKEPSLS